MVGTRGWDPPRNPLEAQGTSQSWEEPRRTTPMSTGWGQGLGLEIKGWVWRSRVGFEGPGTGALGSSLGLWVQRFGLEGRDGALGSRAGALGSRVGALGSRAGALGSRVGVLGS